MEWLLLIVVAVLMCLFMIVALAIGSWCFDREEALPWLDPAPPVPEGGEYAFDSGTRRLSRTEVEKTTKPAPVDPDKNAQMRTEREIRVKHLLNARPNADRAAKRLDTPPPCASSVHFGEDLAALERRANRERRLKRLVQKTQSDDQRRSP